MNSMFPIKKFIRGPNLHEESVSSNALHNVRQTETLTGEEAKQVYEEIISSSTNQSTEPNQSTSTVQLENKQLKQPSAGNSSRQSRSAQVDKPKPTKLTLNQLMRLCESNKYDQLCEYLESYATDMDLNEKDIFGWTLLMTAACAGSHDCLKILLQAGADWKIEDKKGLNAYSHAKAKGKHTVCSIIDEWIDISSDPMLYLEAIQQAAETDDNANDSEPVHCEACDMQFSNQSEHLKSIVHLLSSGEMRTDGKVHYGIPESNRGFQMMLKTGWNKSCGLGPDGSGQKFPVKTVLKRNRAGVGNESDKKAARITHFGPFDPAAVENPKRVENIATVRKKEEQYKKDKEKRKEINYRREFNTYGS